MSTPVTSTARITKQAKLARKGAALALRIAKEANDPMYAKYKKFKDKYKQYRMKLLQKYKNKAKSQLGVAFNLDYLK